MYAYNLPGVKEAAYENIKIHASESIPFGVEERVKVFLLLIDVLCELKEFDEAKKILQKAVSEFSGTP
jgi:pentatricopeptide repeat protein